MKLKKSSAKVRDSDDIRSPWWNLAFRKGSLERLLLSSLADSDMKREQINQLVGDSSRFVRHRLCSHALVEVHDEKYSLTEDGLRLHLALMFGLRPSSVLLLGHIYVHMGCGYYIKSYEAFTPINISRNRIMNAFRELRCRGFITGTSAGILQIPPAMMKILEPYGKTLIGIGNQVRSAQ